MAESEQLDNSGGEDSDGWEEMEDAGEQTTCLFCSLQFLTIAVALEHCRIEHNFDLLELKNKFNMDCYSYIKLINYIRSQKPNPESLTTAEIWNDDVYLKTNLDVETWLMYDFEDLGTAPSTPHFAIDGKTPISSNLQEQNQYLSQQLILKDTLIERYLEERETVKKLLKSLQNDQSEPPSNVSNLPKNYDSEYFSTYEHYGIHRVMLNDKVRTDSYRDAILKNSDSFRDKIVLDVGCGTSILSMFSAKAGASKVYGVDQADVVYKAIDIIRENNLQDTISLIKNRIEDVDLPVDKVDIIVSEWMGYFLLYEGMLDSFIYARDHYLKSDGLILPNRCTLNIVGCADGEYSNYVNFWNDVYGFSMKSMKNDVINETAIQIVPENSIMTESVVIKNIDLRTCTMNTVDFTTNFSLKATKNGRLTELAGYFDVFFELPQTVEFSTGPHAPKTHWKQTLFFLKHPIEMKEGDLIEGSLTCSRRNIRHLTITISIGDNKTTYNID